MEKGITIRIMLPVFCVCLWVAGCAMNPVAVDLVNYVNRDILDIGQFETRALERYNAVTGNNYRTPEAVHEALKNEVIPMYKQFVDHLRKLHPETDEVRDLNAQYIRAAETMYNGFKLKKIGIEKMDMVLIQTANADIERGRIESEKWQQSLRESMQQYKLIKK